MCSRSRLAVIQFAKLSGFSPIIATASPANFELMKSFGATHVIDRKLVGSLKAEVAKITAEPVEYAFDTWSDAESQRAVHGLLAPRGRMAVTEPSEIKDCDGKTIFHVFGVVHVEAHRKLGASLFGALESMLAEGTIKVPRPCLWRDIAFLTPDAAERRGGVAGRPRRHRRRAGAPAGV
jgi:NADPH:quinone reductase-like Zn-dependent oxidoreductase